MNKILALLAISLAGCNICPEREPIIVTKTVEVPVPVKCVITHPKRPSETLLAVRLGDTSYAKAEAALKDLEAYRWYAKEMEAALHACAVEAVSH